MSANEILKCARRIIRKHARKFKIEVEGIQKPYWIDRYHPLVESLTKAMLRVNVRPVIKGSEGATVITFFQDKNIPAVATGFGSGNCAHTVNEYVKIDNLYKGALALEEFLTSYKLD
jgi:acetylornithine deacetylase/succinyl-diaminopimelate desuccinylase-like protein